jgi:DNA-binding LacI/PurR family transcriptional regulator
LHKVAKSRFDGGMSSPTIYDVARTAGVATSTVSRAFNDPNRLKATTRERVLQAARELGYAPNPHARALMSQRTQTIAMVVSDITNPHYFELIRGAELRAKASGYTLVLVNAEESPRIELEQVGRLARSVDGFLLAASRMPEQHLLQVAGSHTVVLINRQVRGMASVVLDQAEGCRRMVQHLASLGHRSLVYLAGPRNSWMAACRWTAISGAADELGLASTRVGPFVPTVANGGAAADAAVHTGATAVIAHNDLLAIGVLRRLAQRGVAVPDDVSVAGFDNIFAADICTPPLTTLGGAHANIGRAAVELLLEASTRAPGSTPPPQVVHPSELVLRASTGPAARSTS